jgi:hypothetical protein
MSFFFFFFFLAPVLSLKPHPTTTPALFALSIFQIGSSFYAWTKSSYLHFHAAGMIGLYHHA